MEQGRTERSGGYLCTWEGQAARSNGHWSQCRQFFWHPAGCSLDHTGTPHDHRAPCCPHCGSRWSACPDRYKRSQWRLREHARCQWDEGSSDSGWSKWDRVVCYVCWGKHLDVVTRTALRCDFLWKRHKTFRSTKQVSSVQRKTKQYAWNFLHFYCGLCGFCNEFIDRVKAFQQKTWHLLK